MRGQTRAGVNIAVIVPYRVAAHSCVRERVASCTAGLPLACPRAKSRHEHRHARGPTGRHDEHPGALI